jgi:ferritin-like metal-binding protein YciE
MATAQEWLMEWLRDAYAMEQQAEQMYGRQAQRIENYPEIKARYEQQASSSRRQAERIRECIERHGSSPSALKDAGAQILGMMQSASGLFVSDEIVKSLLAAYTLQHMGIASYRILTASADAAQDPETHRVCQELLAEEEEMSEWLSRQLDTTTIQYLMREQVGLHEEAKH